MIDLDAVTAACARGVIELEEYRAAIGEESEGLHGFDECTAFELYLAADDLAAAITALRAARTRLYRVAVGLEP